MDALQQASYKVYEEMYKKTLYEACCSALLVRSVSNPAPRYTCERLVESRSYRGSLPFMI
ncbi:MAG TPA: hypothetical protein PK875_14265, partial [Spirochaetota bacterium]|nr:hypothetical protein [Spirochaetota bacterium]